MSVTRRSIQRAAIRGAINRLRLDHGPEEGGVVRASSQTCSAQPNLEMHEV